MSVPRPALLLLVLLIPATALAGAGVSAHCDGGDIAVSVVLFNDEFPPEWTGFVVQRSQVGVCGNETIITEEPLPVPTEMWIEVFHNLSDSYVDEGVYQVYQIFATNAAGDLLPVWGMGMPGTHDFAACGEALATRGFLTVESYEYFELTITECPDNCWLGCGGQGYMNVTEEQFNELLPYVFDQIPVDLYGVLQHQGMPVMYCPYEVTRIEPSPNGVCGPVPAVKRTWDGVKAYYR
jgi:hypothetical protein